MINLILAIAHAGEQPAITVPVGSVVIYLLTGLIAVLFTITSFLLVRTLKQLDESRLRTIEIQDRMFAKLDNLCEEFYALKGEFKARERGK